MIQILDTTRDMEGSSLYHHQVVKHNDDQAHQEIPSRVILWYQTEDCEQLEDFW